MWSSCVLLTTRGTFLITSDRCMYLLGINQRCQPCPEPGICGWPYDSVLDLLLPFTQSKKHSKHHFLTWRRGRRGEAEGEERFVLFFTAENYLGLNKTHLFSHALPSVQELRREKWASWEKFKVFCVAQCRAISKVITNDEGRIC